MIAPTTDDWLLHPSLALRQAARVIANAYGWVRGAAEVCVRPETLRKAFRQPEHASVQTRRKVYLVTAKAARIVAAREAMPESRYRVPIATATGKNVVALAPFLQRRRGRLQ